MALWDELKQFPSLISKCKPLAHIFNNPDFQPGLDIKAFRCWLDRGMDRIGHFFTAVGPITLAYCSKKLEIPDFERFRFQHIGFQNLNLLFSPHMSNGVANFGSRGAGSR